MEDNRTEQREALETLVGFNERLVKNMGIIISELSGQRMEDTDKLLKSIIDAMNWEIAVMNGTMELLNEGKERINKDAFNQKVKVFGDAIKENDDIKMAEGLKQLMPEFAKLGEVVKEVLG